MSEYTEFNDMVGTNFLTHFHLHIGSGCDFLYMSENAETDIEGWSRLVTTPAREDFSLKLWR